MAAEVRDADAALMRTTHTPTMPPMARPPVNAITLPLDPARFDGMQITDMRYKANGRGYVPRPVRRQDEVAPDAVVAAAISCRPMVSHRRRFSSTASTAVGRKPITTTEYSHRSATVSPDGKWIVFAADSQLRPDSELRAVRDEIAKLGTDAERTTATRERIQADLFVMPVAGGTPRRIQTPGNEGSVEWSPDSSCITYRRERSTNSHIYVADATTVATKSLTTGLRNEPDVTWQRADEALVQLTLGGRNALYRINTRTGDRKEIIGGRRRLAGFTYDAARTKVAYVGTSVDSPTELYSATTGATRAAADDFNEALNKEIAWSPGERFTYKSVGDLEIEGWLMKPYGYEAGKKYPLVLYIHGGPHSAYGEGWFDEFQNLAGAGMWVLYTNPRGSSGYGARFTYATRGRWGAEDYRT